MESIIELNDKNKIEPTFYIEVGILFDGEFIRQRLETKEKDLHIELIGRDIKNIMQNLKVKQLELLNKNNAL